MDGRQTTRRPVGGRLPETPAKPRFPDVRHGEVHSATTV
jgi:hypothetical protein